MASLFFKDRADTIGIKDDNGFIALHKPAVGGHEPMVRLLLENGPSSRLRIMTAYHRSRKPGMMSICRSTRCCVLGGSFDFLHPCRYRTDHLM